MYSSSIELSRVALMSRIARGVYEVTSEISASLVEVRRIRDGVSIYVRIIG